MIFVVVGCIFIIKKYVCEVAFILINQNYFISFFYFPEIILFKLTVFQGFLAGIQVLQVGVGCHVISVAVFSPAEMFHLFFARPSLHS